MILKSKIFHSVDYNKYEEESAFNEFLLNLQGDKEFISFESIFPRRYDILITYWAKKLSNNCNKLDDKDSEFLNFLNMENEKCYSTNCSNNIGNVKLEYDFSNFDYLK